MEARVGTILQCASNYMEENNLSSLSQLLEKVSTKLDSTRKVNHADILVKLGQKGFNQRLIFLVVFPLMLSGNL